MKRSACCALEVTLSQHHERFVSEAAGIQFALYSWYPAPLKRYCERLAVTTHPQLANHAKYPAVNWFSFYSLRDYLEPLGFRCLDCFDLIDDARKGKLARIIIRSLREIPPLRFFGHVATAGTYLVAIKCMKRTSTSENTPTR